MNNRFIVIILKIYVVIALVVTTVLSPLVLSFVPVLLLIWYLYQWRWPISAIINFLNELFMFFSIALLFSSIINPLLSLLSSLPLLFLVNNSLGEAAESYNLPNTRYARQPTNIFITIVLIFIILLGVSIMMSNLTLLLTVSVLFVYISVIGIIVLKKMPAKPLVETLIQHRIVAGTESNLTIKLNRITNIGSLVSLESLYEWLTVNPNLISLKEENPSIRISFTPTLSGPSIIKIKGKAIDRWGLLQVNFELDPVQLYVIPRARYAAWLVKKYLSGTKAGALPLISNIEAMKPIYGLRRGIEYYGSQLYQPGDSLKYIDWKHSLKANELISKEFSEFQGQSAVILINLSVGDAEEADKLAYNILVTAISLAQENIPAALAVYNHVDVKLTTATLHAQELLVKSLQVAQEMITYVNPRRYLNPPDISRLRANINRLRSIDNDSANSLSQLLRLEYTNFENAARTSPTTRALTEVLSKADKDSNIIIISNHNHDVEALAFSIFNLTRKGNAIINV